MIDVELLIKQVDASMSMEDMPLTNADKDRIRNCVGDRQKVETEISRLVVQFTEMGTQAYER